MSRQPIVMSGVSREALVRLLEVAGPGSLFDVALPPSLGTLKQARISATLDVPGQELGRWLAELGQGDDPRRKPRTSAAPSASSARRLIRRTRIDSEESAGLSGASAVEVDDDDEQDLAVEVDSASSGRDDNPFVDAHARERRSSAKKKSEGGSLGKEMSVPQWRRRATASISQASHAAEDSSEEEAEKMVQRRLSSPPVPDGASQQPSRPKGRPRATPKKKPRKSTSRRAESAVQPMRPPSPQLEQGTWNDIERYQVNDRRTPAVFGLIPFSPEPEDEAAAAAMDDVDELAEEPSTAEVRPLPAEDGADEDKLDFWPDATLIKEEKTDRVIPPAASWSTYLPLSRSPVKEAPMDPSILFSPSNPSSPRLRSPKQGGVRSRSTSSEPSSASTPPAGLASLVPSYSPSVTPAAPLLPPAPTDVEALLDRLSQNHRQSYGAQPVASSSRLTPPLPQSSASLPSQVLGSGSSSSHPRAPQFRVISRPSAIDQLSTATLIPATLSPSSQRPDLPRSASDAETSSHGQSACPTVELAVRPAGSGNSARSCTKKRRHRDMSADEDEAIVTPKLEDTAPDEVPATADPDRAGKACGDDAVSSGDDKARRKGERKARRAGKRERKRLKMKEQEEQDDVAALVGSSTGETSQTRRSAAAQPLPSSERAAPTALECRRLMIEAIPKWTSLTMDRAGKAIGDCLLGYGEKRTRMMLLKELFNVVLDLHVTNGRFLLWSIMRRSEAVSLGLSELPRQAFQRWLLQDIREADRWTYAQRIPVYAALFGLNPPTSVKINLDQHLARLTGPSPPTPQDFAQFNSLISDRLATLEEQKLLGPAFDQLRALSASTRLSADARAALQRLIASDTCRRSVPVAPHVDPHARCFERLDRLDVPAGAADVRHLERVVDGVLNWVQDAPRPQGTTQPPDLACVVGIALDRRHPFFRKPYAGVTFFRKVRLGGLHEALLHAIKTCSQADYADRVPAFAEMLVATVQSSYLRAYIDAHLARLTSVSEPTQTDIRHLIDIIRPAGAKLDNLRLLVGVFGAFMKLRDEQKLDIGSRMIVNDLIYLRRSGWTTLPR